jgi:hypothetical protein
LRFGFFRPSVNSLLGDPNVAQLVRFLVVEHVHLGSSPQLSIGARIFLDLFQDLTDAIVLVVGDVPVHSETLFF